MKSIQIDDETAHRLRIFIASENSGKIHGKIGVTAALAINRYIDQVEQHMDDLAKKALGMHKSRTCMGLDDTVPAGVSPLCEAKHTGFDAYKASMCEHEPAAWCSLRGIWVCRKCCQLCYEDMHPEGCMEAEDIWRTRFKVNPPPLQ